MSNEDLIIESNKAEELKNTTNYEDNLERVNDIEVKVVQKIEKVGFLKSQSVDTDKSEIHNSDFKLMKELIQNQTNIIAELENENISLKNKFKELERQQLEESQKLEEQIKINLKKEINEAQSKIEELVKENKEVKEVSVHFKNALDNIKEFLQKHNLLGKFDIYTQEKEIRKKQSMQRYLNKANDQKSI